MRSCGRRLSSSLRRMHSLLRPPHRPLHRAARELPPPCDPRPCCHRRIRCSRRVGSCRGSSSQEADGITAHDRSRRNRGRYGRVGRVGDLLLARVLGLGRAHFPFAPRGSTVSRRQRHCGEPWCHAAYPAHTSVESARHEWAPKSPRYSTTAPTRTSLEAEPGTAHGHQAGSKSLNGCRSTLQGRIVDTAWRVSGSSTA